MCILIILACEIPFVLVWNPLVYKFIKHDLASHNCHAREAIAVSYAPLSDRPGYPVPGPVHPSRFAISSLPGSLDRAAGREKGRNWWILGCYFFFFFGGFRTFWNHKSGKPRKNIEKLYIEIIEWRAIYLIYSRGRFWIFFGFLVLCFPAFLLACCSASLLFCFFASLFFCLSASLLVYFSAFLLLCFSASLLFCFLLFLLLSLLFMLLCFSALPASFLFGFSAFPASLLFCFCASMPFYFYTTILFLFFSHVLLLLYFLLLCFSASCLYCLFVFVLFFSFALFSPVCILNETLKTLGETQRNPKEILIRTPDKKPLHETLNEP